MDGIVICGFPASGKTTVAQLIASKLNFELASGSDILREIAKEKGYKPIGVEWWDTKEGMKFLKERGEDPAIDEEVDRRLIARLKEGNVVITSYTLPWITQLGFKVWLDAGKETRAKRMAQRDNLPIEEARKIVEIRDAENVELYQKLYGFHFGKESAHFDLVLNVDDLSPEEVADRIIRAFKEKDKNNSEENK